MNDPSSLPTSPPAAPTLKDLLASRRLSLAQLIWLAVCVLTCAALLRWTMHDFPLAQVWQGFRMAHPAWLAFTLVGFVSGQLLRWLRWQRLLSYDVPAPLRDVGKSLMDGQLINWLSPVRLGDVWRAWQAMHIGGERSGLWAIGSILLEKSADSLVLALFALMLLVSPTPFPNYNILFRLGLGGLAGVLVIGGLSVLRPGVWQARALARLPQAWQARLATHRLTLPGSVKTSLRHSRIWLELATYSLGIWIVGVGTNVALTESLGIHLTWTQHLFFMLAIQLGVVLSTVPANIGLFPLVAIGVFELFGLDKAQALVFGSMLYVLVYSLNVILWLVLGIIGTFRQRHLPLQHNLNKPHNPSFSTSDATQKSDAAVRNFVYMCGVRIDALSLDDVVAKAVEHVTQSQEARYIVTPNAQHIVLLQQPGPFRDAYAKAWLAVPDGTSLLWLAELLGTPLHGRVNGTDLFEKLCGVAAQQHLKVFFLGGRPHSADLAAKTLKKTNPDLQVVGTHCPAFGFENDPASMLNIKNMLDQAQPHILFIGLGAPKQENWISTHYQTLNVPITIGIGGSFDLVAGVVRRAPRWMRNAGLEWFFRLLVEPRRLWKRYFLTNPKFIFLALQQLLKAKTQRIK